MKTSYMSLFHKLSIIFFLMMHIFFLNSVMAQGSSSLNSLTGELFIEGTSNEDWVVIDKIAEMISEYSAVSKLTVTWKDPSDGSIILDKNSFNALEIKKNIVQRKKR